jgi:hypothetical protein
MSLYLGVDPGKSGSLAFVTSDGVAWTVKGDSTYRDLVDAIQDAQSIQPIAFALIECVSSSPQMGVVSAFSFGRSYGSLEMLLTACGVAFERITPVKWQNAMKCRTGGDKNISKNRAQELFPTLKVTHANADALLLAELAHRQSYAPDNADVEAR